MTLDVPSPIDLKNIIHAKEWADTALIKRPYRTEFFKEFSKFIVNSNISNPRILELGSGPGFLAKHVLDTIEDVTYVALDFSNAMHQLAKERIGKRSSKVEYLERNFREVNWVNGLEAFDFIITNQAVHELRHKSYAVQLHKQVKSLLKTDGQYLLNDHYYGEDGMSNNELYMTREEQLQSLVSAGFTNIQTLLIKGGMSLYVAK